MTARSRIVVLGLGTALVLALAVRDRSGVRDGRERSDAIRPVPAGHEAASATVAPAAGRRRPVLRVLVRDGRRRVREAEVTVRTAEGVKSRMTDRRGRALFRLDGPGRASVHAETPRHVPAEAELDVADRGARVTLELAATSALSGRLRGWAGAPPRLSVVAISTAIEGKMATAPLSATGDFRIERLEPGEYAVVLNPDVPRLHAARIMLAPGEHGRVELEMPALGRLGVTTILADAVPGRVGEVELTPDGDGAPMAFPIALEESGRREIAGIPAGRWAVELHAPGMARRPAQIVEIAPGATAELVFAWPTARLDGRVTVGARPAAGAVVAAFRIAAGADGGSVREHRPDHAAAADLDGRYVLAGLEPGHYVVGALGADALGSVETLLGDGERQRLDLALETITTVRARVTHRGRPVRGAHVFATAEPHGLNARSGRSGEDGVVELGSMTRGPYRFLAVWGDEESGAQREAHASVRVTGDGASPIELALH